MHSSLTPKPVDYEIDFVDCQRLENLVDKLSLSQDILKSIKQISYMIRSRDDSMLPIHLESDWNSQQLSRLPRYIEMVQGFERTAASLERQATRTSLLVSCRIWR
jgi:hypothetical protein